MFGMFRDAAAFNQPLAFDTASVTIAGVSVFCLDLESDHYEKPDSDFLFPYLTNLPSDGTHVRGCSCLQSATVF